MWINVKVGKHIKKGPVQVASVHGGELYLSIGKLMNTAVTHSSPLYAPVYTC